MYMWGKIKSTGDDSIYPKPLMDLSVAFGFAHSLVVVDRTNVADQLEQLEIYDGKLASEGVEEPSIEPPSLKQTNKKAAAKTTNKRKKKSEESSDTEDESVHEDDNSSDSEANGFAEKKSKRGGKSAGHGRGCPRAAAKEGGAAPVKRGRGRPKKA